MRHSPPEDFDPQICLKDLPTLSAAGITGSFWHSEGAPIFCPRDDTTDQWPILSNAVVGVSIVIDPHSKRLFRIGGVK